MTPRRTGIRWLNVTAGGVWFLASLLPFLFLGWTTCTWSDGTVTDGPCGGPSPWTVAASTVPALGMVLAAIVVATGFFTTDQD